MANTLVKQATAGGLHFYFFKTASSGTSETVALPTGKDYVVGTVGSIGGTPTAATFTYTRATGVGTFAGLTASDAINFMCVTD